MNDNTNDMVNQMNNIAVETAQTLVDAAYIAEQQSAQLIQAWLNTLTTGQQQQREMAQKLVQQAQEAQKLLSQYARESLRAGTNVWQSAAQQGVQTATETVTRANQATNNAAGNATNAAKTGSTK